MKYTANPIKVDAYKITRILGETAPGQFLLEIDTGANMTATPEMTARMTPSVGDYWVVQPDGYVYLNPKEVFESKYSSEEPSRHPMFENLGSPDKPVIEGLEEYETLVAVEQSQYFPLRTLQQRAMPAGVLTRWTFTDEQRRAVGRGADVLLEQLTFRNGLPPVRLILADRPNPSAFKQLYQLERPLKPCPTCSADLSKMGREEQKKHLGAGATCHTTPKGQVQ